MQRRLSVMLLMVSLVLCWVSPVAAENAIAIADKTPQSVQLIVDGRKTTFSNGLMTVRFDEYAVVTSWVKNGTEFVKNLPTGKQPAYLDHYINGSNENIAVTDLRIISNTSDEAHVAYIDNKSILYLEYHIIMKKGESGLYFYVVAKNNSGKEYTLSSLRTVYRLDYGIFDNACNFERRGKQPTHAYMDQFKKLQDETYELPDGEKYTNGKIYSKYDYSGYFKDNPVWGQYGHGFGFWCIPVSTEYFPSGPLKQELLVHYDAITLNCLLAAHYGSGDFKVPVNWQKFYGPWLMYVNCGTEEQVVNDAVHKAVLEQKKWPYTWVNDPLYPAKRAEVTGKVRITHNRSSEGAMVVLAGAGGDLMRQLGGYMFYAPADKDGKFKLDRVRPGTYTLYAYATKGDITNELSKDNVVIGTGKVNLGEVSWDPPYRKNKLWQIGLADRSAAEFKFGSELRNHKWHAMVPETLDYVVGKSNDRTDWYYAQTKDGEWNIKFNLKNAAASKHYLTVALAGFSRNVGAKSGGNLAIKVNGKVVKTVSYPSDTTIYRSGMKNGWNHLVQVELSTEALHAGDNVVTLRTTDCSAIYDTLLLESD
jgi:rhamnogalacturonan endolyase